MSSWDTRLLALASKHPWPLFPGRDSTQTVGPGWRRGWAPVCANIENLLPLAVAMPIRGQCSPPQGTLGTWHSGDLPQLPRHPQVTKTTHAPFESRQKLAREFLKGCTVSQNHCTVAVFSLVFALASRITRPWVDSFWECRHLLPPPALLKPQQECENTFPLKRLTSPFQILLNRYQYLAFTNKRN